ncbi:MAG: hypothetical protein RR688_11755, partial [Carnobacterium sp.]
EPTLREKDEISRWQKNALSNFPIFLPELSGSTNFLIRLVLVSQLFEKKMKFRDGKKTPYQISLFSCQS